MTISQLRDFITASINLRYNPNDEEVQKNWDEKFEIIKQKEILKGGKK